MSVKKPNQIPSLLLLTYATKAVSKVESAKFKEKNLLKGMLYFGFFFFFFYK